MIIVFGWIVLAVAAGLFLLLFGWPGRYRDRTMAWHLASTTAITMLEQVGLLLAGVTLVPAAIILVGSIGIMGWRIVLLVRQRRNEREGGNA